jgi:mono/diheme cytochrome c family protein
MTPAYRTWLARDNLVRHEAERLPRCCRPRAWLARIDRRGALVTPPLRVVGAIGLAVALAGAPLDAAAQDSTERGRVIAERLCARCHAISGPGPIRRAFEAAGEDAQALFIKWLRTMKLIK